MTKSQHDPIQGAYNELYKLHRRGFPEAEVKAMLGAMMVPPSVRLQQMGELRDDVERVLDVLKATQDDVIYKIEPVNEVDLHCVDVMYRLELDGCNSYEVIIGEASPSCSQLHKLVLDGLPDRWKADDMPYIEVRTEW